MTPEQRIDERARECWLSYYAPDIAIRMRDPYAAWKNVIDKESWRRVARQTFAWERDAELAMIEPGMTHGNKADSTADAEVREIQLRAAVDNRYAGLLLDTTPPNPDEIEAARQLEDGRRY